MATTKQRFQVLNDPALQQVLPKLRDICSQAESCLESHWAKRIIGPDGSTPAQVDERLATFPYYANYEELARLEMHAILACSPPHPSAVPKRVAFIGSGPMPLTSLCLLRSLNDSGVRSPPDTTVLNIDCDQAAIDTSADLVRALGPYALGMEFKCADAAASDCRDLREFNVVYVAALVGQTQMEKEDIILRVASRMKRGALLVMRSAWGLRTCLYPELDITASEEMRAALRPCLVLHPYGEVVNSVVVARVR